MSFLTRIAQDDCSICFSNLGDDGVAHQNGGEQHPVHRRCLEIWSATQQQQNQHPNCPSCRINVTAIETRDIALIRTAQEGDLESVKTLLTQGPFDLYCDFALLKASQAGQHQVVEVLLQKRRIGDSLHGQALEIASENGRDEVIRVLLQ